MLKRLAFLAVIYQDNIVDEEYSSLESLSSADFSFLIEISNVRPRKVAQSITNRDEVCFRKLCTKDFLSQDSASLNEMSLRWLRLAGYVRACSISDKDLIEPISQVVQVPSVSLYCCFFANFSISSYYASETIILRRL